MVKNRKKASIVVPVYNEEQVIERNVEKIRHFLIENIDCNWTIIIANNGSSDKTLEKAMKLSEKYSKVTYINIGLKGRGMALRKAWTESDADILAYMDADLSTDLSAFPRLIDAIEEGNDIVTGSRFLRGSVIERSFLREYLSRGFNFLLKIFFNCIFSDAQCGFKVVNKKIVEEVVPKVKDNEWFFDTELLIRAEKSGFKIKEIPIHWIENPVTKVQILRTIVNYFLSILRLRFELAIGR